MSKEILDASNTNESLSKLYTIRAGLSAVMQDIKLINKLENDNDSFCNKFALNEQRVANLEGEIKNIKKGINERKKIYSYEQQIRKEKKSLLLKHIFLTPIIILLALGICFGLPILVLWWVFWYGGFFTITWFENHEFLGGILNFLSWPISILLLVGGVYCFIRVCRGLFSMGNIGNIKHEIYSLQSNYPCEKYNAEYLSQKKKEFEISRDKKRNTNENYNALIEKNEKKIKETEIQICDFLKGLNSCFSDFIDFRDWSNVDLLIYYFETKRVDSLKEGLLYVDREKQVERIEDAIENAATQLGNYFKATTEVLCKRLDFGFNQLKNNLSKIDGNLDSRLCSIYNEQKLANALSLENNKTSLEIMENINDMEFKVLLN